jgi:GT2 family glycosyltransferase
MRTVIRVLMTSVTPTAEIGDGLGVILRVAVVIVVHGNGGDYLRRALDALQEQTIAPARVIVVDNATTDGSVDGLEERYPAVEVVRSGRNVGFPAANNLAVRMTEDCEWVALLNPDAFPEPGWLAALLDAARENPRYSFFGSRLLRAGTSELDGTGDCVHVSGTAWRRDQGRPASVTREAGEVFSACAAAALYRRDAFLEVGGFDESFFCYYEDNDLAFRLRLVGHRCLYVPDAVVHHVGSGLNGVLSDFSLYHCLRNIVWMWVKDMPLPLLLAYLPRHLLLNLLDISTFSRRGRASVVLRAKKDAVLGLPRVLKERRRVQAARTVGSWELRRALARGLAGDKPGDAG